MVYIGYRVDKFNKSSVNEKALKVIASLECSPAKNVVNVTLV